MNFKKSIFLCSSHPEDKAYEFFTGTALGEDFIILDSGGWKDFKQTNVKSSSPTEGRFFVCRELGDTKVFRIETDSFGTEAIFIFQCPGDSNKWAISNSLQYLAETVVKYGWGLTVCEPAIASIFLKGSIGKQPLSSQTVYSEIKLLQPDNYVEVSLGSNIYEIKKREFRYRFSTYEDAIVKWFSYWRSVVKSLSISNHVDDPIIFDITGGVDSRMMMSIALSINSENVEFFSTPHKLSDYKVASDLCEKFNRKLRSTPPNWHRLSIEKQYHWYLYGNCGFYTAQTPAPLKNTPSYTVRFTGVGGENYRNFYQGNGCQWINKIQNLLPEPLKKFKGSVTKLFLNSIVELGFDPVSGNGMVEHYRKYRSRIIGGRSFYENLKFRYLSPLFDSYLLALSDEFSVKGKDLYRDILLLGGGFDLCNFQYDSEDKKFDLRQLEKSPFWNGGRAFFNNENDLKELYVYSSDEKCIANVFSGDVKGGSLAAEINKKSLNYFGSDCFLENADLDIVRFIEIFLKSEEYINDKKKGDYQIHSALIPYITVVA